MSKVKHGIYLWIKHNQLPSLRGKRKVQKAIEDIEKRLVQELGGWKNITAGQELLARAVVKCFGVLLLSELFINKYGPLNPVLARRGVLEYQPIFKAWATFQNSLRLNLEKLFPNGLDRKVEEGLNLATYLSRHYPPDKSKGKGKDEDSQGSQEDREARPEEKEKGDE